MKNLIFLLAFGFIYQAQANGKTGSMLNLQLYNNGMFTARLDNHWINSPTNSCSFNNLAPGRHFLKVVKVYPSYGACSNTMKVIFSGYIVIPAFSTVNAFINIYNKYEEFSIVPFKPAGHCSNGNYNDDMWESNYYEGYEPHPNYDYYFLQLKNSVMNASFDRDKLNIAKQGIAAKGVTSQQVLELMGLLSFESNKLKLAEFAYNYTFDKQNYFMVNNGFAFSSSINQLNKYLSAY